MRLAVVIPALNEEAGLPGLLASLREQSQPAQCIVLADGGSRDATVSLARQAGAEVIVSQGRGRGGQVAAALAGLSEEVVLVAHADMRLPPLALHGIRQALTDNPSAPGGCLGHRFDQDSFILRLVEWFDRRRAIEGESYGDQAQFFRRERLAAVGGFPEQPLMEDVELSRRLRLLGVPLYLDIPVTVSARRFRQMGFWRVLWSNHTLRRRYRRLGAGACAELYQRYYRRTGPST